MVNKIRLRLTLINTAVLVAILICISTFAYVAVSYDTLQNADRQLISFASELRRFIPLLDRSLSRGETAKYDEEYSNFEEKLKSASVSYSVWNENFILTSQYANTLIDESIQKSLVYSIFNRDTRTEKVLNMPDGTYFIHNYTYENSDIRICTLISCNSDGNLRILQLHTDMKAQNTVVSRLLTIIIVACLIGTILSFVSSFILSGRSIIPIQENLRRQKEFIADASHELRTPITIIRTNLDVLKASSDETVESQMQWIDNAYSETERMHRLIQDLLFLARADLDRQQLTPIELDLNEKIHKLVDKLLPTAKEKHTKLLFEEKEPIRIFADADKIEQLLLIIVDNAMKYSKSDAQIRISAEVREGNAVIKVQDNGIGIDQADLEHIFDRFYRADKARSRREGGAGLGLSIAKRITQLSGGEIFADSKKGEGTTITILLPVLEGDEQ